MGKRGDKVYPSNPLKNNQGEKNSLLKILEFLRSNWAKWNNKTVTIFIISNFLKILSILYQSWQKKINQCSKGINCSYLKVAYNSMYKSTEFLTGVEWAQIYSMKSWAVSPHARAHWRENGGKEGRRRRGLTGWARFLTFSLNSPGESYGLDRAPKAVAAIPLHWWWLLSTGPGSHTTSPFLPCAAGGLCILSLSEVFHPSTWK